MPTDTDWLPDQPNRWVGRDFPASGDDDQLYPPFTPVAYLTPRPAQTNAPLLPNHTTTGPTNNTNEEIPPNDSTTLEEWDDLLFDAFNFIDELPDTLPF